MYEISNAVHIYLKILFYFICCLTHKYLNLIKLIFTFKLLHFQIFLKKVVTKQFFLTAKILLKDIRKYKKYYSTHKTRWSTRGTHLKGQGTNKQLIISHQILLLLFVTFLLKILLVMCTRVMQPKIERQPDEEQPYYLLLNQTC
jgi:hypothetical protein